METVSNTPNYRDVLDRGIMGEQMQGWVLTSHNGLSAQLRKPKERLSCLAYLLPILAPLPVTFVYWLVRGDIGMITAGKVFGILLIAAMVWMGIYTFLYLIYRIFSKDPSEMLFINDKGILQIKKL